MAWARIDDGFPLHPKTLQAGPFGAWLYVCGLCYCNRFLTDGFIPEAAVPVMGLTDAPQAAAAALVQVGLWDKVKGGFQVHDYAEHNRSKGEVKDWREKQRARKEAWRKTRKGRPGPAPVPAPVAASVPVSVPASVTPSVPMSVPPDVPVLSHPIPSHPILSNEEEDVRTRTSSGKSRRSVAKNANDQRFELFWTLHWPKTRRVGKKEAKSAWDTLGVDDDLFDAMVKAVTVQAASLQWQREGGAFIPHLVRWLRKRRWEDDPAGYPTADQVDATSHVGVSRSDKAKSANQALAEKALAELKGDAPKALDDGNTVDAEFWPDTDDEGGDDD
jgi:hypothetical protein